jgi:hypothetical protein
LLCGLAGRFFLGGSGGSGFRDGSLGAGNGGCFVGFPFRHIPAVSQCAGQSRNTENTVRKKRIALMEGEDCTTEGNGFKSKGRIDCE